MFEGKKTFKKRTDLKKPKHNWETFEAFGKHLGEYTNILMGMKCSTPIVPPKRWLVDRSLPVASDAPELHPMHGLPPFPLSLLMRCRSRRPCAVRRFANVPVVATRMKACNACQNPPGYRLRCRLTTLVRRGGWEALQ